MAEYKLQANIKVGNHLINVTGSDPTDFQNNLQWVTTNAAGIVSAAVALETAYQVPALAANTASVQVTQTPGGQYTTQPAPQQQYQQPAPQQAPQGGGGPAPSCVHGAKKWVPGGIAKATGSPYEGFWACTAPREQQCKRVWNN